MCLISVCRKRGLSEEEINNGFEKNSDGAGFARNTGKAVSYVKGFMSVDSFKEAYFGKKLNEMLPHIVHFRKTSGTNTIPGLTHPFIISENSELSLQYKGCESILFHNGTMSQWKEKMFNFYMQRGTKIPSGTFSDTRFIAILTNYLGTGVLHLIDDKFVVVSPKKVSMIGKFTEEDGILFSNSTYKAGGYSYQNGEEFYWSSF